MPEIDNVLIVGVYEGKRYKLVRHSELNGCKDCAFKTSSGCNQGSPLRWNGANVCCSFPQAIWLEMPDKQ